MPINLANTGCLANVNVSEFINGASANTTYSGIASLSCIPFIIQNIIFWLLVFAGTVALILVIIAGIKFITSGGDAKQAEGARKTLTFAILGLVLILFSFAILNFIAKTTGINCITKFGFDVCQDSPPKEVNPPDCGFNNPHGYCPPDKGKCTPIKGRLNAFECKKTCNTYNDCSNKNACENKTCVSCDKAKTYLSPCGNNYVCKDKICQYDPGF